MEKLFPATGEWIHWIINVILKTLYKSSILKAKKDSILGTKDTRLGQPDKKT